MEQDVPILRCSQDENIWPWLALFLFETLRQLDILIGIARLLSIVLLLDHLHGIDHLAMSINEPRIANLGYLFSFSFILITEVDIFDVMHLDTARCVRGHEAIVGDSDCHSCELVSSDDEFLVRVGQLGAWVDTWTHMIGMHL